MYAEDRAAVLAHLEVNSVDSALDALFLVPFSEATCGDSFTGVVGPCGEWAWGRDSGADLPPWLAPRSLTLAPSPVDTNNGAQNHRALAATHWWDECDRKPLFPSYARVERNEALAPLAAAYYKGGAAAVIKAACGARDGYSKRAWALAMTAVHGPVGMHPSQEQHPEVIRAKAHATTELETYLSV